MLLYSWKSAKSIWIIQCLGNQDWFKGKVAPISWIRISSPALGHLLWRVFSCTVWLHLLLSYFTCLFWVWYFELLHRTIVLPLKEVPRFWWKVLIQGIEAIRPFLGSNLITFYSPGAVRFLWDYLFPHEFTDNNNNVPHYCTWYSHC